MGNQHEEAVVDQWIDPVIEYYKAKVDRAAIKRNLRLTVDERFVRLMERQRLADERRNIATAGGFESINCPLDCRRDSVE